ncbi:hypothetical protein EB796_012291 [Bugula neritina]|uniref:Uncharacterized protein n=1 Tax=Bugula neritina TaxID=10212 RepID=A0A7J7JSS7_BUGNE|nr:hypothetical protein EB796_012291 [Bugula neritina]
MLQLSLKEDVVGELDTAVSMKLEGSVKADVAKMFQTSIEGSRTVTAENDFGELFIKTVGEYDMVQFFKECSVQLTSPLISQLLEKKKKIFVVTGIGSIQGDSTLTYKVDQDSRVAASVSIHCISTLLFSNLALSNILYMWKLQQYLTTQNTHSSASADVSVTGEKESARGEKLYVPDGAVIMYRLTRVEINKQTGMQLVITLG